MILLLDVMQGAGDKILILKMQPRYLSGIYILSRLRSPVLLNPNEFYADKPARYSFGVFPVNFLNMVLNVVFELNPES